jgi:monofunctional biosynthetic peptidoglycan transglycosylase
VQRRLEALFSGKKYEKRYTFVPLSRISPELRHAVIAAEDGRFYQHSGIDWKEVQNAVDDSVEEGKPPRGASTITQQLLKNLLLTTHRSVLWKVVEFTLAPISERILSKDRILELYLNVIEWGPGVYGAEAAAHFHYGISASRLNRDQSARLAACIPAPRRRKPQRMDDYSSKILWRMGTVGW